MHFSKMNYIRISMLILLLWCSAPSAEESTPHKMGVCSAINDKKEIFPILDAASYVYNFMGKEFEANPDGSARTDITVRIVEQPKHGRLLLDYVDENGNTYYGYQYFPDAHYFENHDGNDYFVMEAKSAEITVKIYYTMSVVLGQETWALDAKGERVDDLTRCALEEWKISQLSVSGWANGKG